MNPFRWLLDLSAELAQRRGGEVDPRAFSYDSTADSRDYEARLEISGAHLLVTNRKWPERWTGTSADGLRLARVVQTHDGGFRLDVYERSGHQWRDWDGPSIFASLLEAQTLGEALLAKG
jgi:hypothetical protein